MRVAELQSKLTCVVCVAISAGNMEPRKKGEHENYCEGTQKCGSEIFTNMAPPGRRRRLLCFVF